MIPPPPYGRIVPFDLTAERLLYLPEPADPPRGGLLAAAKSACVAVVKDCLALRPVHADGVAPVPVQSCFAYLVKDAHADGCRLCHLDNRAGVPLIEEIDEGAARRVALLANLPAGC